MKAIKNRIKQIICIICVAALLLSGMVCLDQAFLRTSDSFRRYDEFWTDPSQFDVWFLGTSHVYYTVQPMELWKTNGITSYNVAAPSAMIAQTYWTFMCALDKAEPKLVVMDTYELHMDTKLIRGKEKTHTNLDRIPLSKTKLRALWDLTDHDFVKTLEFLLPLSYNHYNWKTAKRSQYIKPWRTRSKNARLVSRIEDRSENKVIPKDKTSERDLVAEQYLVRIIDECKKRDIPILLTAWPYFGFKNNQKGLNSSARIAEENGVPLIDIRYDGVLDTRYECMNLNHVNYSGCCKLNKIVSDYLKENYDLPDHRGEESELAREWDKEYENYHRIIGNKIEETDNLNSTLIWMRGDQYSAKLWLSEGAGDETTQLILDSIENIEMISAEEAKELSGKKVKGDAAVLVIDQGSGKLRTVEYFDKNGNKL